MLCFAVIAALQGGIPRIYTLTECLSVVGKSTGADPGSIRGGLLLIECVQSVRENFKPCPLCAVTTPISRKMACSWVSPRLHIDQIFTKKCPSELETEALVL